MKIYRLRTADYCGEPTGFEFFSGKREAKRRAKEEYPGESSSDLDVYIEELEFQATKEGILELLKSHFYHPNSFGL